MSEQQYLGNIYVKLEDFLNIQDGFSFGEKLTQLEKTANQLFPQKQEFNKDGSKVRQKFKKDRFINLSDKEIYEALIQTIKSDYYTDD